jgi:putative transposase
MGIDIGLRQLAVASIQTREGKEIKRQFHNGKEGRNMEQTKKLKAIKVLKDKEQRWMTDLNHKISR